MRIALNGVFWGMDTTGSGQYVRRLLPALLDASGNEEYLLLLPGYVPAGELGLGPRVTVRHLRNAGDLVHAKLDKLWFEQASFPRACRRLGVDLAHVPYFGSPRRSAVPTIATIHDLIPLIVPGYAPLGGGLYERAIVEGARRAALVLTDSQASARDILSRLDLPEEHVRVIPLAAGDAYSPLTPNEYRPVLRGLGASQPYILYLGGFDRRKAVPALIAAFARARPRLGDVTLVIAGRVPARHTAFFPDPRVLAGEAGIADAVHCTGWVAEEDKPALYAGAVAFCFPSTYEGFGLPVLEAISCGTPAVVSGGTSLPEVLGPGGIVVPPHDVPSLADALVDLVEDPEHRRRLAEAGLRHAAGYSWARTARETLRAYRDAVAMSA